MGSVIVCRKRLNVYTFTPHVLSATHPRHQMNFVPLLVFNREQLHQFSCLFSLWTDWSGLFTKTKAYRFVFWLFCFVSFFILGRIFNGTDSYNTELYIQHPLLGLNDVVKIIYVAATNSFTLCSSGVRLLIQFFEFHYLCEHPPPDICSSVAQFLHFPTKTIRLNQTDQEPVVEAQGTVKGIRQLIERS